MTHLRIIMAIAFALTTPGIAQAQQKISIPSLTPASLTALLHHETTPATVTGELYLPPKANGPVPALVLLHGSGGLQGRPAPISGNGPAPSRAGASPPWWSTVSGRAGSKTGATRSSCQAGPMMPTPWRRSKFWLQIPVSTKIGSVSSAGRAAVAPRFNTALESVRKSIVTDDLKFALHVIFYGSATFQFRDRATDKSPMMFLHGEADNYVIPGPTREFADWAKSQGNPVTFISYPKAFHDFDVQGQFSGFLKTLESSAKCDLVTDLSNGRTLRMNHVDNPKVTADDVRAYVKSCVARGASLGYNAAARADARKDPRLSQAKFPALRSLPSTEVCRTVSMAATNLGLWVGTTATVFGGPRMLPNTFSGRM